MNIINDNSNNNKPPLPKGWVWTKLGEISEIEAGNPASQGEQYFDNLLKR